MLSLSEDLLLVLEPADLVISCHAPCLPKWGEKNLSNCGESENFDFKEGLYYRMHPFFKGGTESFQRK